MDTISGIEHYEISIGTSPGDSNKVSWLKIDSLSYSYSSSLTFKDLGLENELINFLRQIEELLKLNNEKIQPLEPILINLIEKTREYIVYNTNFFNVKSLLQILLKDVKILLNQPKKRIITYFFSCFFSSLK